MVSLEHGFFERKLWFMFLQVEMWHIHMGHSLGVASGGLLVEPRPQLHMDYYSSKPVEFLVSTMALNLINSWLVSKSEVRRTPLSTSSISLFSDTSTSTIPLTPHSLGRCWS